MLFPQSGRIQASVLYPAHVPPPHSINILVEKNNQRADDKKKTMLLFVMIIMAYTFAIKRVTTTEVDSIKLTSNTAALLSIAIVLLNSLPSPPSSYSESSESNLG